MNDKTLIIIDSNSVIHRAFHALPPLTTKKGEIVNAVYGFLLVLFKAIKDFQPAYIAACFDFPAPTFRHEKYKEYKAKRLKAPPELYQQIPRVKEVLSSLNIPIFEKQGFEGDDLIGTIVHLSPLENIIISGDNDNLQLVGRRAKVYALRKGVKDTLLYDEKLVAEKYQGLTPAQLLDFRALKGDPSDNIPGVPGIGEKTATSLILEFGTIEKLYEDIALVKSKLRELLARNKEQAFLSKELSRIRSDAPIDFKLDECRWAGYDKAKAVQLLQNYDFYSLINRLP